MLEGRRIVVTGGHGFIGARVVRLLHDAGADVVAPYRPDSDPADLPGAHPALDIADADAARTILEGATAIVHLAARSGGIQFQDALQTEVFDANLVMTRSVLEAAAAAGVARVFLASSAVVYSPRAGEELAEDATLVSPGVDRVSGYAWSKLTDEALGGWFADAGLEVVVGRFTNVYGPGGSFDEERATVIHSLVRKAAEAAPGGVLEVWGDGSAVRSFVYVDDAARAVVSILTEGRSGGTYNIDSARAVSIADVAETVRQAVDPTLTVRFQPEQPQGPPRRVLDNAALRSLGWEPQVELPDGVAATAAALPSDS